jgi:hypothetical protein
MFETRKQLQKIAGGHNQYTNSSLFFLPFPIGVLTVRAQIGNLQQPMLRE